MKKPILALVLSLAACGGKNNPSNAGNEQGSNNGQSTTQNTDNNSGTSNQQTSDKLVINDGSKLGVLQPIAEQQNFIMKELFLTSYGSEKENGAVHEHADVESGTFGIENLSSEFYLDENIDFFVDSEYEGKGSVFFLKNDPSADYAKMSAGEIEAANKEKGYPAIIDQPIDGYFGHLTWVCVTSEMSSPDLFNAFFVAEGQVCYMVQLSILAEHSAE